MRSMSPELGVLTNQVDEITNIHSSPITVVGPLAKNSISMKILIVNITDGPDIHWGSVLGVSN